MISVLRLVGANTNLSAHVFEENLALLHHPGLRFVTRRTSDVIRALGVPAADGLAGPARAFADQVAGFDFVSPDYEAFELTPWLAALRNASRARARFALFAHSPAVGLFEWTLLSRLLSPGDLVLAPTRSARDVLSLLAPQLDPLVSVVAWPVPRLQATRGNGRRVVTLSRMHPGKHLHSLIDAAATWAPDVAIDIACPSPSSRYARCLRVKTERLGLGGTVRLVEGVTSREDRARFLNGASALVNLSSTVEESFGKAVAEALTAGVPVLTSRWNGLPETVAGGGICVPVEVGRAGCGIASDVVGDALVRLLADPPGEAACREAGARFDPARVGAIIDGVLGAALERVGELPALPELSDAAAAPHGGLLTSAAALQELSFGEAFDLHLDEVRSALFPDGVGPTPAAALRRRLAEGIQPTLERYFAVGSLDDVPPEPRPGPVAELAAASGAYAVACSTVLAAHEDGWDELGGADLVRLATYARRWGRPHFALPWLRDWLERYPDSPDSGEVWLQRGLCSRFTTAVRDETERSFAAAERLLGEGAVTADAGPSVATPVRVRVTTTVGTAVWLTVTTTAGSKTFTAQAMYVAGEDGTVNTARSPAVLGGYTGIDPAGLWWSMQPVPGTTSMEPEPLGPTRTTVRAEAASGLLGRTQIEQAWLAPGVRQSRLESGRIGNLFVPARTPAPAVVVVAGSKGGRSPAREIAAVLAGHGLLALGLAYFGCDSLPARLRQIPVEYAVDAVRALARHPAAAGAVGMIGISRGVELALLAAVAEPAIAAVVGISGSSVVRPGFTDESPPAAAWTWGGVDVPFASIHPDGCLPDPSAPCHIRVDQIAAPLMLVTGGADAVWPARQFAEQMVRRRGSRIDDVLLDYPRAGHGVAPLPWLPAPDRSVTTTSGTFALGGSRRDDAHSGIEAWPRIVRFLSDTLTRRSPE